MGVGEKTIVFVVDVPFERVVFIPSVPEHEVLRGRGLFLIPGLELPLVVAGGIKLEVHEFIFILGSLSDLVVEQGTQVGAEFVDGENWRSLIS